MSKGGVGAEIILSAVMEGGGSGNKVSIKHSTFEAQVLCPPPQLMAKHFVSSTPFLNFDINSLKERKAYFGIHECIPISGKWENSEI